MAIERAAAPDDEMPLVYLKFSGFEKNPEPISLGRIYTQQTITLPALPKPIGAGNFLGWSFQSRYWDRATSEVYIKNWDKDTIYTNGQEITIEETIHMDNEIYFTMIPRFGPPSISIGVAWGEF